MGFSLGSLRPPSVRGLTPSRSPLSCAAQPLRYPASTCADPLARAHTRSAPGAVLHLASQGSPPGPVPRHAEHVRDHVWASRCPSWETRAARATKAGQAWTLRLRSTMVGHLWHSCLSVECCGEARRRSLLKYQQQPFQEFRSSGKSHKIPHLPLFSTSQLNFSNLFMFVGT